MRKLSVLIIALLVSLCLCSFVSADEVEREGVVITFTEGMTEDNKPAHIITVENKYAVDFIGELQLLCPEFVFEKEESVWKIATEDGEQIYPVQFGKPFTQLHGNKKAFQCVYLPEELSGQKGIAKVVLEYEPDDSGESFVDIWDAYIIIDNRAENLYYYTVNNSLCGYMFGYFANGIVFNAGDELSIFNEADATLAFTEDNQAPWNVYAENIEKVEVRNIKRIGSGAFDSCTNLKEMHFYRRDIVIAEDAFSNINGNEVDVYGYYDSTAEAYAKANGFNFIAFDRTQEGDDRGQLATDNIKWAYNNETKEMKFTGNGEMWDYYGTGALDPYWWTYDIYSRTPWEHFDKKVEKLIISDGVKSIGRYAFSDFTELKEIHISDTVTEMLYEESYNDGYVDLFSNKVKEQATIYCGAGSEAEKFAFTLGYKYEVEGAVRGDLNEDGKINAEDALEILKMSAKMIDAKYYQGDYNNNYKLNAEDALLVLKKAAGM